MLTVVPKTDIKVVILWPPNCIMTQTLSLNFDQLLELEDTLIFCSKIEILYLPVGLSIVRTFSRNIIGKYK